VETFSKEVLTLYGPLGIGWLVAIVLGWYVLFRKKQPSTTLERSLNEVTEALEKSTRREEIFHTVLLDNSRAMEHLSTLIEHSQRLR